MEEDESATSIGEGKSQSHSQPQIQSHSLTQVQSHSQTQVQSHSQTQIKSGSQSRIQSHSQTQIQSQSQTQVQSQSQTQVQSHSQTQIKSGSQSRVQSHSQTQIQSGSQSRIQSHSQTQIQSGSQSRIQSHSQTQIRSGSQSRIQSHSQTQIQSQPQSRTQSQSQPRIQSQANATTGTTGHEQGGDSSPLETFCQDQIRIPPHLPSILKQFTKAAIRTQPKDLDTWGAAYFRAMASGQPPPVKETLEYPVIESKDGLTVGLLRVLDTQLKDQTVTVSDVRAKWQGLCLEDTAFSELMAVGHLSDGDSVEWKKVLAVLCTSLGTNLTDTMTVICKVLTEQKEGGDPVIPYVVWWELYLYLARLDGSIPAKQLQQVNDFLVRRAHAKFCLIGPADFLHVDCPPLY